jgi:hypothetical protein
MKNNQKGFSVVEGLLVVIVLTLLGGVGYYVYESNQDNNAQKKSENSVVNKPSGQNSTTKENTIANEPINPSWKTYTSSTQKISFEYPDGWFVREDSETNRIYVSNHQGEFNKANMPGDFQQIWLSSWEQEANAENESSVKSGNPKGSEPVLVTAGTLKAGDVTINTYEHQATGGPKLQAFWNVNGKKFYATNSTEVGMDQQTKMISNLKKLLPTVKHL